MNYYEQALQSHRQHHGKLETVSKVPLNTRDDLSIAYTPGVAEVCREIGEDVTLAREYTMKRNTVAVVTDGSAILGLGDLGPEASLPVMEGKAVLFKEFGNVDAVPIALNTQDVDEIVETVKRIAPTFGGINLEDISAPRCFEILKRCQEELDIPVFHDDQDGTAVVVLAGLINALNITGKKKEEVRTVISGVGAAGVAIIKLMKLYGFKHFVMVDSKGIIHKDRSDLGEIKQGLAENTNQEGVTGDISDALKNTDIFIGVSIAGLVTEDMVKSMNSDAIIFAMANPEPEIMPDLAHSAGAAVVATGRSDFPNQVNNVLAFPGIFRGVLDANVKEITNDMLIKASEALAGHIPNPDKDHILPDPLDRTVAETIAQAIM